WLSREIVAFGFFVLLAVAVVASLFMNGSASLALLLATSGTGMAAVFCSGMTYHVTQRECWRGELSAGRFFGTTAVLGSAGAWCVWAFSGVGPTFFAV